MQLFYPSVGIWNSEFHSDCRLSMESQMVQNSRNKIGLTFNKFVIKVKTDFSQVQQNQFTFNRFSFKVKTFRIKLNKITSSLSRNYLSRARDIWVKLKRSLSLLSTKNISQFHASFHINPKFPITFQQLDLERSSCWNVIRNLGLIWNEAWNWDKFFVESNESDLLSLTQISLALER